MKYLVKLIQYCKVKNNNKKRKNTWFNDEMVKNLRKSPYPQDAYVCMRNSEDIIKCPFHVRFN